MRKRPGIEEEGNQPNKKFRKEEFLLAVVEKANSLPEEQKTKVLHLLTKEFKELDISDAGSFSVQFSGQAGPAPALCVGANIMSNDPKQPDSLPASNHFAAQTLQKSDKIIYGLVLINFALVCLTCYVLLANYGSTNVDVPSSAKPVNQTDNETCTSNKPVDKEEKEQTKNSKSQKGNMFPELDELIPWVWMIGLTCSLVIFRRIYNKIKEGLIFLLALFLVMVMGILLIVMMCFWYLLYFECVHDRLKHDMTLQLVGTAGYIYVVVSATLSGYHAFKEFLDANFEWSADLFKITE
jgi:hypothetical protein